MGVINKYVSVPDPASNNPARILIPSGLSEFPVDAPVEVDSGP